MEMIHLTDEERRFKDGITEEGRKMLQEFMQNRKKRREESKVVLFPKVKNDRDSVNPSGV